MADIRVEIFRLDADRVTVDSEVYRDHKRMDMIDQLPMGVDAVTEEAPSRWVVVEHGPGAEIYDPHERPELWHTDLITFLEPVLRLVDPEELRSYAGDRILAKLRAKQHPTAADVARILEA